ncbi:MAG: matrixin family metalloprotease [Myxococcota bacterium]|jgi:hypothetical protein|nr:matrixin family metalloprotease [Myxococcota bacterium]
MVIWLLLTQTVHAYDTIGATWPEESRPIAYTVQSELGGSLDDEAVLSAIQEGFTTWEQVECADIAFDYQGRSEATWGEIDGQNTVFIIDSGWPEEASMLSTPMVVTDGTDIVEVDIALNAQYFAWDLEDADGIVWFDVQSAITHEVGHLLGLWHSSEVGATLNPSMAGHPEANSLEDDDVEGLCSIYTGQSGGDAAIGEACTEHDDCADGLCLVDGADRYCSQSCSTDSDCPDDWECLDAGGEQVCARPIEDKKGCATSPRVRGLALWIPLILMVLRRGRSADPELPDH